MCSGWGDPHYITFDGTYYTFLDNCTYVLVQQIVPVYGHFRVLIDNYFCDSEDGLSCPQSIIVEYRQERVVLTRKPVHGVMTNEVGPRMEWVGLTGCIWCAGWAWCWVMSNEVEPHVEWAFGARGGRGTGW